MLTGTYRIAPTQTNPWGVASLVSGIVGFCPLPGVGGILAIVFGLLGVRRAGETRTGKGMAVTGLVLGFVSLILWLAIALGTHAFYRFFSDKVAEGAKDTTATFVSDLGRSDLTAAGNHSTGLGSGELQALGEQVQSLGPVKELGVSSCRSAPGHCDLRGTITFEKGRRNYAATLTFNEGNGWTVQSLALEP